ncbi:RNase adapter RapZ [Guyparkeria hydrothermalis]|uniref:RNase adapter RapZ n=1 Tax=Guyparkeria hydrothermalis TaxID=923 RepID=UPI002021D970|nr:RNase adapter RapZ [Guyparkeria hydrothermalis]
MSSPAPRLILVTGQSGSGKSVALAALEDSGFYCIDNLPPDLLDHLAESYLKGSIAARGIAISIDARAPEQSLADLPDRIDRLRQRMPQLRISSLFLEADRQRLITRFSETRRRHPLSYQIENLVEAIAREGQLLMPIRAYADLVIDTSLTTVHQLREDVRSRLIGEKVVGPRILIQSFGFKFGIPLDSDFLFDVRFLPNPHWDTSLRPHSGLDEAVVNYLEQHPVTHDTRSRISEFLAHMLVQASRSDRSYLTCSVGCTGGKHRSVYIVEQIARDLRPTFGNLVVRHRDLGNH